MCVFCGKRPESKTLEHVLPRWLIELTGDPKRKAGFGYEHTGGGPISRRDYSFDAFKFPACRSCNHNYASLEEKTKAIAQKIIHEECLSELELNNLFDWFDKIRIGLWLAHRYLDKDWLGINPHFYIANRIGQHDRTLIIFKADGSRKGLNYSGCDTPSFAYTPSCFSLSINNFCFLNMSYPNLLCRRLGFPYPVETFATEGKRISCIFTKGRNRIMLPVLKKTISRKGTELYQPIFCSNINSVDKTVASALYDTKYVQDNCISWEKGIGKVFINRGSKLNVYSSQPSKEWIPKRSYPLVDLLFEIRIMALDWQLYVDSLQPSLKLISKEKRKAIVQNRNFSRHQNKQAIQILRQKAKDIGMPT